LDKKKLGFQLFLGINSQNLKTPGKTKAKKKKKRRRNRLHFEKNGLKEVYEQRELIPERLVTNPFLSICESMIHCTSCNFQVI